MFGTRWSQASAEFDTLRRGRRNDSYLTLHPLGGAFKKNNMKQFVERITAIGYNTKNQKGSELYSWCKDKYSYVLLNESLDEQEMINDIRAKIKELNEKFPRLKQDIELFAQKGYGSNYINVCWLDKSMSVAFVICLQPVKAVMVGGCLTKEDEK